MYKYNADILERVQYKTTYDQSLRNTEFNPQSCVASTIVGIDHFSEQSDSIKPRFLYIHPRSGAFGQCVNPAFIETFLGLRERVGRIAIFDEYLESLQFFDPSTRGLFAELWFKSTEIQKLSEDEDIKGIIQAILNERHDRFYDSARLTMDLYNKFGTINVLKLVLNDFVNTYSGVQVVFGGLGSLNKAQSTIDRSNPVSEYEGVFRTLPDSQVQTSMITAVIPLGSYERGRFETAH